MTPLDRENRVMRLVVWALLALALGTVVGMIGLCWPETDGAMVPQIRARDAA